MPRMPDVERNAPCPCGSGAKFKRCCLPKQEVARAHRARDLEQSQELIDDLMRFGERRLGWDLEELLDGIPANLVPDEAVPFWSHPFLFHARFPDRSLAEQYLASGRGVRNEEECRARMASWATLMEVTSVVPGTGLVAKDLLTGDTLEFEDVLASKSLRVHATFMGFPYVRGERCHLAMPHPFLLPPREAADALEAVRRMLGLAPGELAARERLTEYENVLIVASAWAHAVDDMRHRPEPKLENTDGDPLLLVEDHFDVPASGRDALLAAIASINGALEPEPRDGGCEVTVLKPGNAKQAPWENTVIGHILVTERGRVTVSTNSERRADDLRARFEAACRPLVSRRGRSVADALAAVERAGSRDRTAFPPDLAPEQRAEVMRELKARMYADWVDTKLPALGGLTPREAMNGSPKEARALGDLLKQMRFDEARLPPEERFDFTIILRQLGMI